VLSPEKKKKMIRIIQRTRLDSFLWEATGSLSVVYHIYPQEKVKKHKIVAIYVFLLKRTTQKWVSAQNNAVGICQSA